VASNTRFLILRFLGSKLQTLQTEFPKTVYICGGGGGASQAGGSGSKPSSGTGVGGAGGNGSANSISISQSGASNNTFNVIGGAGTTNNANTVTATQSGTAGADKSFTLNLNGTNGATVNVLQTNPLQSNTGSMSIQCASSCGTWSYIRQ